MKVTERSFRKAVYLALALSVLGLVAVCLPIIGPKYTLKFATSWVAQIAVGYAAMILVIERVGVPLRSLLTQYWAGAVFAFCLFIVGVLAGSATSMIVYQEIDVRSYVVKPVFWLSMYGFIPAAIIGLIGSGILRRLNAKGEPFADGASPD